MSEISGAQPVARSEEAASTAIPVALLSEHRPIWRSLGHNTLVWGCRGCRWKWSAMDGDQMHWHDSYLAHLVALAPAAGATFSQSPNIRWVPGRTAAAPPNISHTNAIGGEGQRRGVYPSEGADQNPKPSSPSRSKTQGGSK